MVYVFTDKRSNVSNITNIMVAKAVKMTRLGKTYKPVVTGAFVEHSRLLHILEQQTMDSDKMGCADIDHVYCYLLDFGAFLIATNQEDKYPEVYLCLMFIPPMSILSVLNINVKMLNSLLFYFKKKNLVLSMKLIWKICYKCILNL